MLHLLIDVLAPPGVDSLRADVKWAPLWQQAAVAAKDSGAMTGGIPRYNQLRKLHEVRNLVQHAANLPNAAQVAAFATDARTMIRECFEQVFGVDLDGFRPWIGIRNRSLRTLMLDCEEALRQEQALCALVGATVAFDSLVTAIAFPTSNRHRRSNRPRLERMSESAVRDRKGRFGDSDDDDVARQAVVSLAKAVDAEIVSLRIEAVTSNLGVSINETRRFVRSVPHVSIADAGVWWTDPWNVPDDQAGDLAEFALAYLGSVIFVAQEAHPEEVDGIVIAMPLTEQPMWKRRLEGVTSPPPA
jgi:hypothetical protein